VGHFIGDRALDGAAVLVAEQISLADKVRPVEHNASLRRMDKDEIVELKSCVFKSSMLSM